jgi:hypothetical protein
VKEKMVYKNYNNQFASIPVLGFFCSYIIEQNI